MTITKIEDLNQIREKHKDQKVVFCSGSFDLTHLGHILFFEDCKNLGDVLVVAVGDDYSIRSLKGVNRPILNQHVRLKTIDSLKPVDYTLLNTISLDDVFCDLEKMLNNLKPDTYVINEDAFDIDKRKELCERYNINLKILERFCPAEYESISTTSIIQRVIKAYSK